MGPITLFDKSFLQSLNTNESVWFDHFYLTIISPLFFMETLADLEKDMKKGRTAEQLVGEIANKTPELHSTPNVHHLDLVISDLLGQTITMDGRPIRGGGTPVNSRGRYGVNYSESPEEEAFRRWQANEFLEIEKRFAKAWRSQLEKMTFPETDDYAKKLGINTAKCKNIDDAYNVSGEIISSNNNPYELMAFIFNALNVPRNFHTDIIKQYQIRGLGPLTLYAPYAAHVVRIEIFLHICMSRGFISSQRPSNAIDIAYLHYLPFCKIFVSGDKLHKNVSRLFIRQDQTFIWGPDLKADLNTLNTHYMSLPKHITDQGIMKFANTPPVDEDSLTGALWDKVNPNWRNSKQPKIPLTKEANDKIIGHIKEFRDAPAIGASRADLSEDDIESLSVQRSIRHKRGEWYQLPKDFKEEE